MSGSHGIVFVIDDDASIRDALRRLICSVGLQAELFGSAKEFLDRKRPEIAACMTLDIRLPGMSGLDFQHQLAEAHISIPIIFVSGQADAMVLSFCQWHITKLLPRSLPKTTTYLQTPVFVCVVLTSLCLA